MRKLALLCLLCASFACRADIYARLTEEGKIDLRSTPAEGFLLYMKSAEPPPSTAAVAPAASGPFARQVEVAAMAANVEPALIQAVMHVESNHQVNARSPAGAVGLMQLMPQTARRYNVKNLLDPQQNLHAGARYLRDLLDLYKDNIVLALAAYNAGEQAVSRYGNRIPPFSETRAYVPKVLSIYHKLVAAAKGGKSEAPEANLRSLLPAGRVHVTLPAGRAHDEPAQ